MNNIIIVANFFIRDIKPPYLNNHINALFTKMLLFDKVDLRSYDENIISIETLPDICNIVFEDGENNWGRMLVIIWLGIQLKNKYSDKSVPIYNAVVAELLKHKEWVLNQRPYYEKLRDYIKSFFSQDDDNKYFVLS